jgi:hypothetical protein
LAVKPGKQDRKRPQRVDSAAPSRKTSRPPGLASRPPSATSRPSSTSGRPAANSPSGSRSNRPRPPRPDSARSDPPRHHVSQPEITLRRAVAGRDTLSAIAEELAHDLPQKHRPKLDTLSYEDRPSPSRPELGSSPEVISIGEAPIGRATMAAIDEALAADARAMMAAAERQAAEGRHAASSTNTAGRAGIASLPALEPAQIFEISTFIIEGDEIFSKASEQSRRDFVEQRLLHRLPALSMNEVVRIDVSRGAASNTVILRVWSKVGQPPG